MNRFKINNIYNDNGKTLNEIISNYILNFLDNELNYTYIGSFNHK